MCGISYSKVNFEIKKFQIDDKTKKIINLINNNKLHQALELIRAFRNNSVFISIIKNNKIFVNSLNKIIFTIDNFKKNNTHTNNFEKINDIKWLIESEIFFKIKRIIEFSKKNKIELNSKSIIFIRFLLYSLESMNYLESRGRDSLGVSINLISENPFKYKTNIHNKNDISVFNKKISKKKYFLNITTKFSKRIGSSGENTKKIIELLENKIELNKIDFKKLKTIEIFSHTRWASVGEVNNSNAHPLIDVNKGNFNLCLMNGDINNYNELKKNLIKSNKYNLNDVDCNNDLQPVPSLFKTAKSNINKFSNGSYILMNFNTTKHDQFYIYKKGSQGLYYSIDEDNNLHFASDVYGLINKIEKFKILKKNGMFIINNKFKSKILKSEFKKTDLSTIDISLKGMDTFFLKEISDTENFLKRTINKYIDFKKNRIIGLDNLFNEKIKKKLKKRKIKNIIFTGMGTCYTAAVGISKYLNEKMKLLGYNNLKVEATIASEGSGFYLSNDMKNTIIVVIAQSGTTIDTNVFAKMAKERGAYTVAIVNKKQGDVTYIVDQSIYLGNGRDVEMSVPSTKTYTCHLITGYIFSEKIIEILKNKIDGNFLKQLKNISQSKIVSENLSRQMKSLNSLKFDLFKFKNWIVVYDDNFMGFSALELRIKLSECCYKSIPYINVNLFNKMKLKNTLVFYLTSRPKIKKFDRSNFYIISTNKKNKLSRNKNIFNIKLKSKDFIRLTIEISLTLQLIAYKIAKIIDNKSSRINNLKKITKKIKSFILDEKNLKEFELLNKKNKVKFIKEKLLRPLDAIKHQAKTVTVGAIRSINSFEDKIDTYDDILLNEIKPKIYEGKFFELKENINIISKEVHDYEKYYLGNIIEYCNAEYKSNKHYKFPNINNKEYNSNKTSEIFINKKIYLKRSGSQKLMTKKLNFYDLLKFFLPQNRKNSKNDITFQKAKRYMLENNFNYELNLESICKKFNNIKFLGSGINYLIAKKYATFFTKQLNRTIAFDVIENHKHIDISSEALIFVFAANIDRKGFQRDVFSELEKFIAHENEPVIFTNLGNNIFDNLIPENQIIGQKRIIKFPVVQELYSPSIFDFYFQKFVI